MIEQERFALNKAACPNLDIEEFFALASRVGIKKVELRNDIPQGLFAGRSSEQICDLAAKYDLNIITINALHGFNDPRQFPEFFQKLKDLLKTAAAIKCEAIIIVPSRAQVDDRSREQIFRDTVEALKTFSPYFEESGVYGYMETLGFKDCSIQSALDGVKVIRESGSQRYQIVYDTFHHFIGPDADASIERDFDISCLGLVHISGIASDAPPDRFTDDMRVLVGPTDKLGNVGQLAMLEKLGYRGNISFEPFSKDVQGMNVHDLEEALRNSVRFIQEATNR